MSKVEQHGPEKTEGGQREVWVGDEDVKSLLNQILKELKIMRIHMESITDEEVTKGDI